MLTSSPDHSPSSLLAFSSAETKVEEMKPNSEPGNYRCWDVHVEWAALWLLAYSKGWQIGILSADISDEWATGWLDTFVDLTTFGGNWAVSSKKESNDSAKVGVSLKTKSSALFFLLSFLLSLMLSWACEKTGYLWERGNLASKAAPNLDSMPDCSQGLQHPFHHSMLRLKRTGKIGPSITVCWKLWSWLLRGKVLYFSWGG